MREYGRRLGVLGVVVVANLLLAGLIAAVAVIVSGALGTIAIEIAGAVMIVGASVGAMAIRTFWQGLRASGRAQESISSARTEPPPDMAADAGRRRPSVALTTRQVAAFLLSTELFGELDQATVNMLAERTLVRVADKGTTIFAQDEQGDEMFVLAEGAVKLVVRSPRGEVVELARHVPPAAFGEVALVDSGPRSATAEAIDRSTLLVITRDELLWLLRFDPGVVDAVFKSLGGIVRRADRLVADLVFLDMQGRVARRLLELADAGKREGRRLRTGRLTQTDLANMVGGSRQSVNLALRTLEQLGSIRTVGQTIELLDPDDLRRRAGMTP